MAKLDILTDEHPILRRKSVDISEITPETVKLAENMIETMMDARGVGLAAPQVGKNIRMITVLWHETMDKTPKVFINPVIKKRSSSELIMEEGCLSVPGKCADVKRAAKIEVQYTDLNGRKKTLKASKLNARIIQHEIDHLEGILFTDIAVSPVYDSSYY